MNDRGQRTNSRAFVPVSHCNGYTDMPKMTNSLYLLDQLSEEEDDEFDDTWSNSATPTGQQPVPRGWSEVTLTGSVTGRSSYASWEEDEGVLDHIAGEQVGLMFDAIDHCLYEGHSTGFTHVDWECLQWKNNFPHLRVKGVHLLDSLDDGTEIVDPVAIEDGYSEDQCSSSTATTSGTELVVVGQAIKMHPPPVLSTTTEEQYPGLHYEETLASDRAVEEYFAYHYSSASNENSLKRPSRPHRYRRLPPVSPSACLRDTVLALVFDQIWNEVATTLHPLLTKYSRINSRRASFSDSNPLLPFQSHVPIHDLYLDGAAVTRGGQISGIQSNKRRPIAPGPLVPGGSVSTHAMDLPSLQKVMTIKPVALQQRIPSSTIPSMNSSLFQQSVETSESSLFPEFSTRLLPNSRQMSFLHTPVPHRGSEPKIVSGKIGNKRNPLKPIEVPPRTPGLPLMEDDLKEFSGLRGQRLVRHTQLPPIDPAQFGMSKSPQLPSHNNNTGANTRAHVTFSNRIVSADTREGSGRISRKNIGSGTNSDLRPNTSQTLQRSETPLARRGSNNSVGFTLPPASSSIKVVGYAASLHGDPVLWEEQEEEFHDLMPTSYVGSKPRPDHTRSSKTFHGPIR